MNRILTSFFLLLTPLLASAAQMYRWTDDKGQVHYTQTPPPGFRANQVQAAPPPQANPGVEAMRDFNQKAEQESADKAKKMAEAEKKSGEREQRCQQARDNVAQMQSAPAHRMGQKNDDGTVTRMTQQEYDDTLADSQAAVRRYCK